MICQIGIFIFGCSSIWFVGRKEKWSRWGYILGLLSQPFWFIEAIRNEQWGIVFVCCWYSYSWCQGVYNFWIRKNNDS